MKKLHITIALVLWGFAQSAAAQNMYRNYLSTAVPSPESAVSVVHSNGYVYYFQTGKRILSVTELDPVYFNPTGNVKSFDLSQNPAVFDFVFEGAFEGFGGNIVLYGYHNTQYTLWNPIVIIFDPTLLSLQYIPLSNNGTFTEGCAGYNSFGDKIYAFIFNDRELFVVEESNLTSTPIVFESYAFNSYAFYTDISWDATYNKFIASGSYCSSATQWTGPFVDMLEVNVGSLSHQMYYLDNQTYYDYSVGKAMHVKIDDDHLLVYHGLRDPDVDILWMSLVKNYSNLNHGVVESWFYYLPCSKTIPLDLIYDDVNHRFNFLGDLNFCSISPYLAQGNPFSLSSGLNVGMLDGSMSVSTCPTSTTPTQNILNTPLRVNRMAYNVHSPCAPVHISGIDISFVKRSILTETSDISMSYCDKPLTVIPKPAPTLIVDLFPMDSNIPSQDISFTFYSIQDIISENPICSDPEACSQAKDSTLKNSIIALKKQSEEVEIYNNGFVCNGFSGTIRYALYDMAGKLILQGDTRNAVHNTLPSQNGIFLLKTTDESGCLIVTKIFLCD